MTDPPLKQGWKLHDPTPRREFKIVHYDNLGRLDAYTGGLEPRRREGAKIFNLRSDNKTEDAEVMCETRL